MIQCPKEVLQWRSQSFNADGDETLRNKSLSGGMSFSTLLLLPFPISEASPSSELPAPSLLVARAIGRSHPWPSPLLPHGSTFNQFQVPSALLTALVCLYLHCCSLFLKYLLNCIFFKITYFPLSQFIFIKKSSTIYLKTVYAIHDTAIYVVRAFKTIISIN